MDKTNQPTRKRMTKAQRRKEKRKKLWKMLGVEVLILFLLVGSYACYYFKSKMNEINVDDIPKDGIEKNELTDDTINEYTNIALFGLDARDVTVDTGNRSDCIIIASINNKTKEVKLVSVYRDTFLQMTDEDHDGNTSKATHAYAYGGPKAAINMLNRNLDLDIEEYATVNFASLTDAINDLGGVTVNVDEAERNEINVYLPETAGIAGMSYNNLYETGDVRLDGLQATTYCRIRSLAGGDVARSERQREVLGAMVTEAKSSDLVTINNIIDDIFPEISTSLTQKQMLSLAASLFSYQLGENQGFPYTYHQSTIGSKGAVVVPADLEANVVTLHKFLFDVEDYEASETVKQISNEIMNETGVYAPEDPEKTGEI